MAPVYVSDNYSSNVGGFSEDLVKFPRWVYICSPLSQLHNSSSLQLVNKCSIGVEYGISAE